MTRAFAACIALACVACCACGRVAELDACNIARATCQSDVFYAVMRLRGDGWDPFQGVPPIQTITVDAYRKQLQKEADQQAKAAATQQNTGGAPQVDPWDVTLQLLGLVTSATSVTEARISNSVSEVAAFYSSDTRNVTVLDRGQNPSQKPEYASDTALLAHELVHAFQDRDHTLEAPSTTVDGSFADQALIEGEAVLYQYLARVEIDRNVAQQIDWKGFYHANWGDGLRQQFAMETSPYYAVGWFVYPFGGYLEVEAWLRGGNAAVRSLNLETPRHAREFMANYAGVVERPADEFSCNPELPSSEYAFYARNALGAMQVYALMSGQSAAETDAWKSGLDWRGDQIFLFFDQTTQHVAFTWRIRSATAAAAEAIVTTMSAKALPMLIYTREGNADVRIVGTDDPDVLASWPGAVDCGG